MRITKPLTILLALLLVLASVPAAAASDKHSTIIAAECLVPDVVIQVVVPTVSKVYVNPESLPVKVDGKIEESQIISEPACIENQSKVPLSITASVSGVVKAESDMALTSTSTRDRDLTSKRAFIYFEMKAVDSNDVDQVDWAPSYDEASHILVRTLTKTKKKFLTLGAAGKEGISSEKQYRKTMWEVVK